MLWKPFVFILSLLLLLIFTVQNYKPMEVRFLAWSLESSTALIIFFSLVIGFVLGLISLLRRR